MAPVVVGLLKKDSQFVRRHAGSAFNFQVSVLLHAALAVAALLIVSVGLEARGLRMPASGVVLLYALGVWIGSVVLVVLAGMRAHAGRHYRYPLTLRFLKDRAPEVQG